MAVKTRVKTGLEPRDAEKRMFSAASFAGVLSKYKDVELQEPDEPALSSPPTIAFYGFRGGAGRTTALAHVAALLAARQIQVVAIDLDLEAPGLHHVLACPLLEEDRGVLALLRAAATDNSAEALRLAPHVVKSGVDLATPIRVLPAGRLSEEYLERLDDLGVPLWHIGDTPNPLEQLLARVKEELQPQVIFVDCRTGLSGLSAAALFHISDLVICFLPVSEQSLDGLDTFLMGVKGAKLSRDGRPEICLVPSMVPEGPEGRRRLEEWFLPEIEARYGRYVLGRQESEEGEETLAEIVPVVRDGIEYRRGIALADYLRTDYVQRSAGVYQGLLHQLDQVLNLASEATTAPIDSATVLSELGERLNLKALAFAESTSPEEIVTKFIRPSDFKALLDRSTWYIVGAKGAGKTWLWTYLQSDVGNNLSAEMTYVPAHGPGAELLTASAMREIEQDRKVRLRTRQCHGAVWLLYSAKRILIQWPDLADHAVSKFRGEEKRLVARLVACDPAALPAELRRILPYSNVSTLAERLIRILDADLLAHAKPGVTLLVDGLDVGFGSEPKSLEMRKRYVDALIEAVEPLRGSCKRIFFKLFLREDIFGELSMQNQSHLDAAKVELRWEPRDLWLLALNLVSESPHYLAVVRGLDPSAGPGSWPQDDERRRHLLTPLWGAQLEAGNKVSTALFVQRRTSDGKGRLFPRTLVQLLASAIDHQQTIQSRADRVLRSAAIQVGYRIASEKRVEDLRKEYTALGDYLDGLKGMKPTGTEMTLVAHMQKGMPGAKGKKKKSKARGAAVGALHAGPVGWHKVIERLIEIGVLREYKRARGEGGELKYEIALLYRPGLGIKAYGV